MQIAIESGENNTERIKVEYTPVEWIITEKAIRELRNSEFCRAFDRQCANTILQIEPKNKENIVLLSMSR